VASYVDGSLCIWGQQHQKLMIKTDLGGESDVNWSPDGKHFECCESIHTLIGETVPDHQFRRGAIACMAWNPQGTRVATGYNTGFVVDLWDKDGKLLVTFAGHKSNVTQLAWNATGTRLSSCAGHVLRVWPIDG